MEGRPLQNEIRELLLRHRPDDDRERAHLGAMLRLADAAGNPCARDRFEPGHFTASAFVLAPALDAVLLIFHEKLQRWLQPGGHLEPTDTSVERAARREVEEETGQGDLEIVPAAAPLLDLDVHEIPARPGEPAHQHHDLRLLLRARHEKIHAGDGVSAARWVRLDDVEDLSTDESVRRVVRKLGSLTAAMRASD